MLLIEKQVQQLPPPLCFGQLLQQGAFPGSPSAAAGSAAEDGGPAHRDGAEGEPAHPGGKGPRRQAGQRGACRPELAVAEGSHAALQPHARVGDREPQEVRRGPHQAACPTALPSLGGCRHKQSLQTAGVASILRACAHRAPPLSLRRCIARMRLPFLLRTTSAASAELAPPYHTPPPPDDVQKVTAFRPGLPCFIGLEKRTSACVLRGCRAALTPFFAVAPPRDSRKKTVETTSKKASEYVPEETGENRPEETVAALGNENQLELWANQQEARCRKTEEATLQVGLSGCAGGFCRWLLRPGPPLAGSHLPRWNARPFQEPRFASSSS